MFHNIIADMISDKKLHPVFTTNKRELQQIATNHSSDIDLDEFKRFYTKRAAEEISLSSDNLLHFRKNLL